MYSKFPSFKFLSLEIITFFKLASESVKCHLKEEAASVLGDNNDLLN